MRDELSARQAAIRLRLAGEKVESICRTLQRSEAWSISGGDAISRLGQLGCMT